MVHRIPLFAACLVLALGCRSFVKLSPEAEQVRVAAPSAVESCERIGKTNARTRAKVWVFHRRQATVEQELADLARDDAAEMGGSDVAPLGDIEDGKQSFGIYRCPNATDD